MCLDVLSGSTDHPTFALMCRLYSDGQSVSPMRIFFYNFSSFFYAYLILIIKIFKPSCLLLKFKNKTNKKKNTTMLMAIFAGCSSLADSFFLYFIPIKHTFISRDKMCFRAVLLKLECNMNYLGISLNVY